MYIIIVIMIAYCGVPIVLSINNDYSYPYPNRRYLYSNVVATGFVRVRKNMSSLVSSFSVKAVANPGCQPEFPTS